MSSFATSSPKDLKVKTPEPLDNAITLWFPLRAVSFQQARFGKGRVFKTPKQAGFEGSITHYLRQYESKLKIFKNFFNPEIHIIQSCWEFGYSDFFTKKDGIVSSKCLDLDNSIKNIQDVIFKSLEIDDKFIVKSSSHKWKVEKDYIRCSFKILEKGEIKFFFYDYENI